MQDAQPHLLVPMMPTPNGPLHLGHAAGPYLKMDVLARFLRQRGQPAALVTTTDCFESHVLQSAGRMGLTPLQVCAHFHAQIRDDFDYLDIRFDAFINPTAPEHAQGFHAVHARVADQLLARGTASLRRERHLADAGTGAPLLGHQLTGRCSRCDAATVGFVCERCGLQMTTELLREPRGASGAAAEWRDGATLALDIRDSEALLREIGAMRLPDAYKAAMAEFLDTRNIVRITVPGDWGVGRHRIGDEELTLYNTYFGHALYCGEVYRRLSGGDGNPFANGSGVTTVTSCGLDNATDLAASLACARAFGGHRSFDHCLGNFFLQLRGRKFSTGADHAVFVRNLARCGTVDVDALRICLAQLSPEHEVRNFEPAQFIAFHNGWFASELVPQVNAALRMAAAGLGAGASDALRARIAQALRARDAALAPAGFTLSGYAGLLREYTQWHLEEDDAAAWLQGLAVLAWPLAPTLAARIGGAFGMEDMPRWRDGAPAFAGLRHPLQLDAVRPVSACDLPEGLVTQ